MTHDVEVFSKLERQKKIDYMVWFYEGMIKKTDNADYKTKFQDMIDQVKSYTESQESTEKLLSLYQRISLAREKTKKKKLDEAQAALTQAQEKIQALHSHDHDEDADVFLMEQLACV